MASGMPQRMIPETERDVSIVLDIPVSLWEGEYPWNVDSIILPFCKPEPTPQSNKNSDLSNSRMTPHPRKIITNPRPEDARSIAPMHRPFLISTSSLSSAFVLACLPSAVAAPLQAPSQPSDPEAVFDAAHKAYDSKDYKKASTLFAKSYELFPAGARAKAIAAFNVACSEGLSNGSVDTMHQWIERSVGAGWGSFTGDARNPSDVDALKNDTDLARLRADPRFQQLLDRAVALAKKTDLARAAAPAEIATPLLYSPAALEKSVAAPIFILFHGGQGNKTEFMDRWKNVADAGKIRLISLSGPEFVAPGRFGWYRGAPGAAPGAVKKLEARMDAALAVARSQWNLDMQQIYSAGYSQGGGIAVLAAIEYANIFRGAIVAGGVVLESDVVRAIEKARGDAAARKVDTKIPSIYQIAGEADTEWIDAQKALARRFESLGVRSSLAALKIGHEFDAIPQAELEKAVAFVVLQDSAASRPVR